MRMTNADSALNGAGPKHHFTQHATLVKPCLCQASHIMLAICLAPAVAIHAGSASPSGAKRRNARRGEGFEARSRWGRVIALACRFPLYPVCDRGSAAVREGPEHKVAALQPAARKQEP